MPTGVYTRTEKHREEITQGLLKHWKRNEWHRKRVREAFIKNEVGAKSPKRVKKVQPSKKCVTCNKEFWKQPKETHKAWNRRKICCRKCKRLSAKQKEVIRRAQTGRVHSVEEIEKRRKNLPRGERHHAWKNGKTKLSKRIRGLPEYKRWRTSVYKRDGYTCRECGVNGSTSYLNCDHIVPFSFLLELEGIKTIKEAINCKVLWDIDFGKTLCKKCHRKTYTYGEGAKNFEELLKSEGYKIVKEK